MSEAGADPIGSEPKSAPGPWAFGAGAGAAQKSGGSATLYLRTGSLILVLSLFIHKEYRHCFQNHTVHHQ